MATLATMFDRLVGRSGAQIDSRAWSEPSKAYGYKLRPLPNEDVHLFIKRIDNSRVIRVVDPQVPGVCWKLIGGAAASAVLLIGMLLPSGYRLMAGYQIEDLRRQNGDLIRQKAELEVAEAKLLSPERLAGLARLQEFVDPDPGRVVHLAVDKPAAAVAMRRELPAVIHTAPAAEPRTAPVATEPEAAKPTETEQ